MAMTDLLCPGCGCSLVRLGIPRDGAAKLIQEGRELYFCCAGCIEVFREDPERFMREAEDLIVCPTCLSEKPRAMSVPAVIDGNEFRFCRCPTCVDLFRKTPEVFVRRLTGIDAEVLPKGPHCC